MIRPFFYSKRSADELQRDLETVRLWAWQWRMHFNVNRTEEVIFFHKKPKLTHPPLHLGLQVIVTTTKRKHKTRRCSLRSHANLKKFNRQLLYQLLEHGERLVDREAGIAGCVIF